MAHGISLKMRAIQPAPPMSLSAYVQGEGWLAQTIARTLVGPSRDRSLPGKARRQDRKAARLVERRPFFKGHGVASSNAYNQRYECPCGHGIIAPLDDFDFMTEVMEHETWHAENRERCGSCTEHPGWAHGDEARRQEPRDVCRACLGSGVDLALTSEAVSA